MKTMVLIIILTTLYACSSVTSRETVSDQKTEGATASPPKPQKRIETVPKEQYDQLLAKYETLLRTYQKKDTRVEDTLIDDSQRMAGKGDIVQGSENLSDSTELAETVDVFGKHGILRSKLSKKTVDIQVNKTSDDVIENQIIDLRKAQNLIAEKKYDKSLTILKNLEKSSVKQIKVMAKFLLGDLLFKQEEYDLSMQIFEEIISKYAFSGVVLKTLGRLIICCQKLKLNKKQERYYSVLHDFFEAT